MMKRCKVSETFGVIPVDFFVEFVICSSTYGLIIDCNDINIYTYH